MNQVTEVLVRFDDDTEIVIDNIGDDVTAFALGQKVTFAIYRVRAGEMELDGDPLYIGATE